MRTIVKDVRCWSSKAQKWLLVDVEVDVDPERIGRLYASKANLNKSGRSKHLNGLVSVTRLRSRLPEEA